MPISVRNHLLAKYQYTIVALVALINLCLPQNAGAVTQPTQIFPDSAAICLNYEREVTQSDRLPVIKQRPAKKTIHLTVTAYSSTVDQTDSSPFITASGTHVHDGTLAHNYLPIGTQVRFPDIFGNKIFVVEDRLNARYGPYMADIWMPTRDQAIQWGAKVLRMEIL
ncbi:MAG: hypothetical protein V1853_05615 [bacterium]